MRVFHFPCAAILAGITGFGKNIVPFLILFRSGLRSGLQGVQRRRKNRGFWIRRGLGCEWVHEFFMSCYESRGRG